jgi:hypothetical protein
MEIVADSILVDMEKGTGLFVLKNSLFAGGATHSPTLLHFSPCL